MVVVVRFMLWTAAAIALAGGEFQRGVTFCSANPIVLHKIGLFALCSAIGQSFIFYTIANFEPLVCSTVCEIYLVIFARSLNNTHVVLFPSQMLDSVGR